MPETTSLIDGNNIIKLNATGTDNKKMSLFFPNGEFIYGGKDMPAGIQGDYTNQFVVTSFEQPSIELTKLNNPIGEPSLLETPLEIKNLTLKYNSGAKKIEWSPDNDVLQGFTATVKELNILDWKKEISNDELFVSVWSK